MYTGTVFKLLKTFFVLSYFFVAEKHATGVQQNTVTFSEENYGLTAWNYDRLVSIKDWRGYTKKRDHQANRSLTREANRMLHESAEVNASTTAEVTILI